MGLEKFMKEAVTLALKAKGMTYPNPAVGAVVVNEKNEIIGQGFHPQAGLPHAEVYAINDALNKSTDLSGATLFITLEPCGHFGKTPPCTKLILEKEIKRVIVGTLDPHPLMQGRSIELLKDAGVDVQVGVCEEECQKLIRGFSSHIKNRRPFVTLKCAASLDGKISTHTGESKWITGGEAREYAHVLRSEHDAILVGVGTVLSDNPGLDVRLNARSQGLIKVVLDTRLQTPADAKVFSSPGSVIIYCDENYSQKRKAELEKAGAQIVPSKLSDNQIDLEFALQDLAKKGIQELMVEGGASVLQSFIKNGSFDEIKYFIAPKIIANHSKLSDILVIDEAHVKKVGSDFVFEGRRQ